MTGNDGRFRGKFAVTAREGRIQVRDLKRQTGTQVVKSLEGVAIPEEEWVRLGEWVKAVLLEGQATLLVCWTNGAHEDGLHWQLCNKKQLKQY